ncbi:TIGR01777 family oxidoreductase [Alkalihalobacillus sp. MEB130]|uniref:TIGR01777 family oxidoreductase n=1 Tax=Alkalihalobacillus sp. MEB130 TaxID=2976704 RepID=UPI0028DF6E83|nr:TIGR01777 family oxidoreductase [Alkalihalobacillus sp. MEB130]MDT8860971.1 TIGR01777 family oxidoreductase [Alkalihalobacillus sp. MEB130]
MKIAIAGGTGFLGSKLTNLLLDHGHVVIILTRDATNKPEKPNVQYIEWLHPDSRPEEKMQDVDAIINLAGESIGASRWTPKRKQQILQSRINSTKSIVQLIEKLPSKPNVLVNASAIGFYGNSETDTFTEQSTPTDDSFLSHVVQEWEKEAEKATAFGVRVVYCRLGVVLDPKEGALKQMLLPYRLFIGGPLGTGKQWLSWIHIDDAIHMFKFVIEKDTIHGAFNVTAPHPCQMNEFGTELAKVLHRPHYLPTPGFALKILLGEMSTLVLDGQKVIPEKAISQNYPYLFPTLPLSLENLFEKGRKH